MSSRNRRNKALRRQVRQAYSQDRLAHVLMLPEEDFGREFGMETVEVEREQWWNPGQVPAGTCSKSAPDDYYHFKDNGSRVLSVAHLDTVVRPDRRAPAFRNTAAGPKVVSGALDDRLGAYVILDLLPQLGITCDQLLTVGEEDGASTASEFKPGKDYDWVIEFDRGGTDVVMYQYDDHACRKAVQASGAQTGTGSFSDIAYLEHLDVKCFNWGAGYDGNYHSEKGYAYLNDTFAMTAKYLRFHEQNAGTAMPHVKEEKQEFRSYRSGRWQDDYDSERHCWVCGLTAVDLDTRICDECGSCGDCYMKAGDCLCYTGPELGKPAKEPGWLKHAITEEAYSELFGTLPQD
jgi:hypothetical protein